VRRRRWEGGGDGGIPRDLGNVVGTSMAPVLLRVALWVLGIALALFVLAVAAIVLVPLGVVLAVLVLRRPGGVGARVRAWRVWGHLPGMTARRGAAGFAALVLLYTVAVPGAAMGMMLAAARSGGGTASHPVAQATPSPAGVALDVPAPTDALPPTPAATPAPTDTPAPAPTATPTPEPTAVPTPRPAAPTAAPPAPPKPTKPPATTCGAPDNPWGYNFCGGAAITNPPSDFCVHFNCIKTFWNGKGYVIECRDNQYSKSGGISGSCSQHGGNNRKLYQP
jgi:hypothetical protein